MPKVPPGKGPQKGRKRHGAYLKVTGKLNFSTLALTRLTPKELPGLVNAIAAEKWTVAKKNAARQQIASALTFQRGVLDILQQRHHQAERAIVEAHAAGKEITALTKKANQIAAATRQAKATLERIGNILTEVEHT